MNNQTKQLINFEKAMDANLRLLRKLGRQLRCNHAWNESDPRVCNNCGIKVRF